MSEELRREFATIEDAYNALPPKQQEHGVRVGEYLKVMFLQACSLELYAFNAKASVRLREDYTELMPVIGRWHDVAKALVPAEYHEYRQVFSPEETALYRKHSLDGAQLVRQLLEPEKRYSAKELNYIVEGVMDHHERWDGTGFPDGRAGENSSIFARLLAVADALDHYSMEKHSEQPLEFALNKIKDNAGTQFDPLVVEMLMGMKGRIKRIFTSHIAQSRAIPVTETFIRRSGNRPFELWYRPVVDRKKETPVAFEAVIRFRNKREWMDYPEVDESIRREKLAQELGIYMTLEACDMLTRLDACGITAEYIALELPTGWLNRRGAWRDIQQVLTDTEIAASRLCFDIGERTMANRTPTMQENLKKLVELGCRILLSALDADALSRGDAKELSATMLRITTELLEGDAAERNVKALQELAAAGIEILEQDIVKKRHQPTLNKLKVRCAAGPLAGELRREDDCVERELAALDGELPPEPKPDLPLIREDDDIEPDYVPEDDEAEPEGSSEE